MVEFVRDVMIAVAVLATLIALAAHPAPDAEPQRHGSGAGGVIAISAPPAIGVASAVVGGALPN
jgi:hypothetical protein